MGSLEERARRLLSAERDLSPPPYSTSLGELEIAGAPARLPGRSDEARLPCAWACVRRWEGVSGQATVAGRFM